MNIGDLFLQLLADDSRLEADVVKAAQKAGDAGGKTLGQRMSTNMSSALKAGLAGIGAVGGALFGIAARGAADLTDAMAGFRAETGATQAEVDSATKSVVALSRTNLQSFDEIARTQAKLRTDLGLTQAEAEKATDAFLKYGTATGRDAAEGVAALDDITDAWNLDASKSGEIMDQLVASHQKFGGSITDNERALSNLAPQLQALNLNVDDGIGLLNLFAASGLDAGKAQFALNSAIQKLPPGESLEQFIARLSTIPDDGKRAQEAIKVFGARGGAGLANAIRPGVSSLDAFKVSADDAAGAVERASDAIESTPLNQLKLFLKNATGPLIEFGQGFGPLLLAFSQLGGGKLVATATAAIGGFLGKLSGDTLGKFAGKLTGLGPAIGRALGGIAIPGKALSGPLDAAVEQGISGVGKSAGIKGALGKLGSFLGSGLGTALAVGFAAVAVVELARVFGDLQGQVKTGADNLAKQHGEFLKVATLDELKKAREGIQGQLDKMGHDPVAEWLGISARPAVEAELARLDKDIAARASVIPSNLAGSLDHGTAEVSAAAGGLMHSVSGAIEAGRGAVTAATKIATSGIVPTVGQAAADAKREAAKTPQGIADGIKSKRDQVDSALDALREAIKNRITVPRERVKRVGELVSTELARGLRDKDPAVKAQAEATRSIIEARLLELVGTSRVAGQKALDALAGALKDKDPAVRAQAQRTKAIIEAAMNGVNTVPAGEKAGQGAITGLDNKSGALNTAGQNAGKDIGDGIATGVTKKNTKIGAAAYSLGRTIARNLLGGILYQGGGAKGSGGKDDTYVPRRAAGGPVLAGQPYVVGEHRRELFVPMTSGMVYPSVSEGLAAIGGTGGDTYNIPLTVEGALPVRTIRDISGELQRLSRFGVLSPKIRSARWPLEDRNA